MSYSDCFTNEQLHHALAKAVAERDKMRAALQRLADCDWVITPHDRMDAVRKIARDALEAAK